MRKEPSLLSRRSFVEHSALADQSGADVQIGLNASH
jgi:hypothetical protein